LTLDAGIFGLTPAWRQFWAGAAKFGLDWILISDISHIRIFESLLIRAGTSRLRNERRIP